MNTIEQAARRLEQLRRAGIDVSEALAPAPVAPAVAPVAPTAAPVVAAPSEPLVVAAAPAPAQAPRASARATSAPQAQPLHDDPSVIEIVLPGMGEGLDSDADQDDLPEGQRRSRTVDLNFNLMHQSGLLVPGMPRTQLEDEIRIIKRPLLDNVRAEAPVRPERANLIMVTSALPGEGKTQTAINLDISIATELDHTVLLVEADVIKPSVLGRLGLVADRGLLDLLQPPVANVADVLLRTNIPKLSILPAGRGNSQSTELLASTAMENLLDDLASKYSDRVIIFDTPPLMPTTESRVLASRMGQVVLVVESGKTPRNVVEQVADILEEHPLVLAVLNKYTGPKNGKGYGYYAP
jgi:protein-tyrosine kinase